VQRVYYAGRMHSMFRQEGNYDGKLPVFVFPTTLNFYIDDQSSHKQVLTLYNPYEFTVLFKVLCNNPVKYNVVETEGLIKSKCCIDIVIRVIDYQCRREDKFRIHLYEHGLPKLLGKKDILAVLCDKVDETNDKELTKGKRRPQVTEVDELFQQHRRESVVIQRSLPSVHVLLLLLVCILVLMLPTQGDDNVTSSVPKYLYLSVNQKLIAAFILGLVTMAVLKP